MKQPTINPDLPVELTVMPDYQTQPFVIAGNYEAVMPIAESIQAADKALPVVRTRKHGKRLVEAATAVTDTFVGRIATDFKAKVFDYRHNTNLHDQLVEKRENEKIVKMGVELGLISLSDTICQRHQHAVDQLKV